MADETSVVQMEGGGAACKSAPPPSTEGLDIYSIPVRLRIGMHFCIIRSLRTPLIFSVRQLAGRKQLGERLVPGLPDLKHTFCR